PALTRCRLHAVLLVGVWPRRARGRAARVPRIDEKRGERGIELGIARAAAAVDGLAVGVRSVGLAAVAEPRLVGRWGPEAEDDGRVTRSRSVDAGELQGEDEVVGRSARETVRVIADDHSGAVRLADTREDDRARVVGLVAAVAGTERLGLNTER